MELRNFFSKQVIKVINSWSAEKKGSTNYKMKGGKGKTFISLSFESSIVLLFWSVSSASSDISVWMKPASQQSSLSNLCSCWWYRIHGWANGFSEHSFLGSIGMQTAHTAIEITPFLLFDTCLRMLMTGDARLLCSVWCDIKLCIRLRLHTWDNIGPLCLSLRIGVYGTIDWQGNLDYRSY